MRHPLHDEWDDMVSDETYAHRWPKLSDTKPHKRERGDDNMDSNIIPVDTLLRTSDRVDGTSKDIDVAAERVRASIPVDNLREYDDYTHEAQQGMWRAKKAIEGMLWVLRRGEQK